jgi:hypothetical protein
MLYARSAPDIKNFAYTIYVPGEEPGLKTPPPSFSPKIFLTKNPAGSRGLPRVLQGLLRGTPHYLLANPIRRFVAPMMTSAVNDLIQHSSRAAAFRREIIHNEFGVIQELLAG